MAGARLIGPTLNESLGGSSQIGGIVASGLVTQIPRFRKIQTPGELTAIVGEIRRAIDAGLLEQVHPSEYGETVEEQVPLRQLAWGPWPDLVHLVFRSPETGERYVLRCETYHGAGGSWGPEAGD